MTRHRGPSELAVDQWYLEFVRHHRGEISVSSCRDEGSARDSTSCRLRPLCVHESACISINQRAQEFPRLARFQHYQQWITCTFSSTYRGLAPDHLTTFLLSLISSVSVVLRSSLPKYLRRCVTSNKLHLE